MEVATATIDLEDIRSYRNSVRSRNIKAASAPSFPRIDVTGFALSGPKDVSVAPSKGQFRLIFKLASEHLLTKFPPIWLF